MSAAALHVPSDAAAVSAVELVEGVPRPSAEWSALALAADNIFLTPEWLLVWWRHFGRERRAYTLTGRDVHGRLEFLALAYVERERPVGVLRLLGHGPSDELGPVCRPTHWTEAMTALLTTIGAERLGSVLVADHISEAIADRVATAGSPVARIESPTLRIAPGGWEELLASRRRKFRAEIRRLDRKLAKDGFSVRRATEEREVDAALDWLLEAHRHRSWSSSLHAPGMEAFHREFAHLALARGWLRCFLLERNGEIAAIWYGFRFGRADYYYQQARSEACPTGGAKHLSALAIRATCDDGLAEHRFLRGGEGYKYEWTNEDHRLGTFAFPLTPVGATLARTAAGALSEGRWSFAGRAVGRAARRLLLS